MKRRSFLAFLGLAPAAPIVGRAVASLPAVAAATPTITPLTVAASAATLMTTMYCSVSVVTCSVFVSHTEPGYVLRFEEE